MSREVAHRKPARRESERARRKRTQIREGALQVFLADGFSTSSMDQVSASAGVSKQTLYAYYRSKDELLMDVISTLIDAFDERVPELWNRPVTTRDELRESLVEIAVGVTTIIMNDEYLALVRLIVGEMFSVPGLAEIWRRTGPAQLMERIGGVLRRGQEAGVVRDVDLELATRMLVGPVMSYVLLDGLARPGNVIVPQRSRLEALIDLYLEVVT